MKKQLRPFIGSKNYEESLAFYKALGFKITSVGDKLSYLTDTVSVHFYLQDYYVKDWVDNSMLFLVVDNVEAWYQKIVKLGLIDQYERVILSPIKHEEWGSEFFLHDPSGVLWHIGKFL